MKALITSLLLLVTISCFAQRPAMDSTKFQQLSPEEQEMYTMSSTPDSLLSPEMLAKKTALYNIYSTGIKIDNDKIVVTATEKTFEDKGLSPMYLNIFKKSIERLNTVVTADNVKQIFEKITTGTKPTNGGPR
jgi:hypothetical protein